jgi:hypothetical protein
MPVLDDYFGSTEPAEMPPVRRTNWPHAPEHLRPILDEYESLTGFHPQGGAVKRLWIKGAQEWYDEFGLNLGLMGKAFRKLMRSCDMNPVVIRPSHPGALIKTALGEQIRPDKTDQERWLRENLGE